MYSKSSKISILQQLHSMLEFYKRLIEALGSDEKKEVHCFDKICLREAKQSRDGAYDVFLSFRGVDCRCQHLTRNWYYCDIFWGPSQFQLLDRTEDDSAMGEMDHSSSEQLFQLTSLDYKHYLPRQRISTWRRAQNLSGDLGECTLYTFPLQCTGSTLLKKDRFSLDNHESRVAISIDLMEALKWDGKITSQLPYYSTGCNLNKHMETKPRGPMYRVDDTLNQHNRKQIVCVSSFVIVAYMSLSLLVMCSQSPLGKHLITTPTQVQPLHGPMSIGVILIDLLDFLLFVWAVVIRFLVGAPFTRMQSAMLLFWAFMMHIKSAYSISVVYVPLLGIYLVGRYGHGKATAK